MTDDTRITVAAIGATAIILALTIASMFWIEFAMPDWLLLQAIAAAVLIFGVGAGWYLVFKWLDAALGGERSSKRGFLD